MATRGIIAFETEEGQYKGRYHHWDSYPDGLGATLHRVYHKVFNKDVAKMKKVLFDDHPAGFSTINEMQAIEPYGFDNPNISCYCHGNRKEEGVEYTEADGFSAGTEYIYIIKNDGKMDILSYYKHSKCTVDLNLETINFEEIKEILQ